MFREAMLLFSAPEAMKCYAYAMTEPKSKSRAVTLVLSLVLGGVGLFGAGHFYLGYLKQGLAFLFSGIALFSGVWAAAVLLLQVNEKMPDSLLKVDLIMGLGWLLLLAGLGTLALFGWQVKDALALAKNTRPD